jgi:hypothetical protein
VKKSNTTSLPTANKTASPNTSYLKADIHGETFDDFDNARKISKPTQKLKYHGLKSSSNENGNKDQNSRSKSKDIAKRTDIGAAVKPKGNQTPGRTSHSKTQYSQQVSVVKSGKFVIKEKDFYSILHDDDELLEEGDGSNLSQKKVTNFLQRNGSQKKPTSFLKEKSKEVNQARNSHTKNILLGINKGARVNNRDSSCSENRSRPVVGRKSEDFSRSKSRPKFEGSSKGNYNPHNVDSHDKKPNVISRQLQPSRSREAKRTDSQSHSQTKKGNFHQPIQHKFKTESSFIEDKNRYNSGMRRGPNQAKDLDNTSYRSINRSHQSINLNRSMNSYHSRSRSTKKVIKQFDEDLTFKPMLSKKSMQLAQKLPSSRIRLTQGLYKKSDDDDEEPGELNKSRSKPKINKRSDFIDKQRGLNEKPRFERLYEQAQVSKKMNEQQRIKKIEEELEKEIMLNRSKTPTKRRPADSNNYFTSEADVAERNLMWRAKKEDKIEKIRNIKEMLDTRDCTFKPKLDTSQSSYKKITQVNPVYTSNFAKDGLKDHFTRIEIAKKNKSYREMNEQKSRKNSPNVKKETTGIYDQYSSKDFGPGISRTEMKYTYAKTGVFNEEAYSRKNSDQGVDQSNNSWLPSDSHKDKSLNNIVENLKRLSKK